jgi:hypothetical protein
MRIFMPGLAKQMQQEGTFELKEGAEVAEDEFMLVEDRGADVTLFAFSGIDVLFAGMGRFEFRGLFKRIGRDYNLVFLRDLHRLGYHVAPDGSADGIAFHTDAINAVKARLGAKTNLALGSSSGGQAAFYFGTVCGMDGIVAFGPAFPLRVYIKRRYQLQALVNLPQLFREPMGYIEVILVCIGAWYSVRQLLRRVPKEKTWRVMEAYQDAAPRPHATIFYGRHAPPDARQAQIMRQFEEVKLIALDTGRHNTPAYLKSKGLLEQYVSRELRDLIEAAERRQAEAESAHE